MNIRREIKNYGEATISASQKRFCIALCSGCIIPNMCNYMHKIDNNDYRTTERP